MGNYTEEILSYTSPAGPSVDKKFTQIKIYKARIYKIATTYIFSPIYSIA